MRSLGILGNAVPLPQQFEQPRAPMTITLTTPAGDRQFPVRPTTRIDSETRAYLFGWPTIRDGRGNWYTLDVEADEFRVGDSIETWWGTRGTVTEVHDDDAWLQFEHDGVRGSVAMSSARRVIP